MAADDETDDLADEIEKRWDPEKLLRHLAAKAGRGEPLDQSTRAKYEAKLGADLGHVRVFSGDLAKELADKHNAEALTIGKSGMVFMGGTADRSMASASGQALLAHELTHVAQASPGVHRSGRSEGEDRPLATEEHEVEAEQAEAEELASHQGGDSERESKKAAAKAERAEQVKKRVLDMLGESYRVDQMRGGSGRFRP